MDATRQYAPTLFGIAPDHVKRYQFAASAISAGLRVLDAACGCGYGSRVLSDSRLAVAGVDINQDAIEWARKYFPGPNYILGDVTELDLDADVLVTFETLEHLKEPEKLLTGVSAKGLFASVPNEEVYPFDAKKFGGDEYPHQRHYTPAQFDDLLASCGWNVKKRFCQMDKSGAITPGTDGMFLLYVAKHD